MSTPDILTVKRSISDPKPFDVTGMRDRNMQALIVLAVTLGWTVYPATGDRPITIKAPDGTSRRIPTNTSIRMSVFANTLSMILTHSPEHLVPTHQLMVKIARSFKLDAEHQRRLRVAVDETPEEHAKHLAAAEAEPNELGPKPLTQRLEIPALETLKEEPVATEPEESIKEPPLTSQSIIDMWNNITLTPSKPIQWRPTKKQFADWEKLLLGLPHLVEIHHSVRSGRKGGHESVTRRALLDNGTLIYICGWPGCRHARIASPTGHARMHYRKMEIPAPKNYPQEVPVDAESPVTEPISPAVIATIDEVLEEYMDSALQLLDIANGFVSGFERLDDYVRTMKTDPQHLLDEIERLKTEIEELRVKADKYDQLTAILR